MGVKIQVKVGVQSLRRGKRMKLFHDDDKCITRSDSRLTSVVNVLYIQRITSVSMPGTLLGFNDGGVGTERTVH